MFKRDDEALTDIRTTSAVLMLASPVFRKMLTQDMKEKETMQIELPGKCPEEFKVLLESCNRSAAEGFVEECGLSAPMV